MVYLFIVFSAPWTFNPEMILRCLKTLREQVNINSISRTYSLFLAPPNLCRKNSFTALCACVFNFRLHFTFLFLLFPQGSVYAPSFDHGVGDPVEDDIFVDVRWTCISLFSYRNFVVVHIIFDRGQWWRSVCSFALYLFYFSFVSFFLSFGEMHKPLQYLMTYFAMFVLLLTVLSLHEHGSYMSRLCTITQCRWRGTSFLFLQA